MYDDAGTKATNTHLEYIIPIAFPLQEWLCKRSSMLRYAYIAFFFFEQEAEGTNVIWSVAKVPTSKCARQQNSFKSTATSRELHQAQWLVNFRVQNPSIQENTRRHHIQLVLPSVIAQMFYAIYGTSYASTPGNKSYIMIQTSWRLVLRF